MQLIHSIFAILLYTYENKTLGPHVRICGNVRTRDCRMNKLFNALYILRSFLRVIETIPIKQKVKKVEQTVWPRRVTRSFGVASRWTETQAPGQSYKFVAVDGLMKTVSASTPIKSSWVFSRFVIQKSASRCSISSVSVSLQISLRQWPRFRASCYVFKEFQLC